MANEASKLTLAYVPEDVSIGDSFEKLPQHMTILPPFEVSNENKDELFYEYYCLVSAWAEAAFDNDPAPIGVSENAVTVLKAEDGKAIFGTDHNPIIVRRITCTSEETENDFLTLRKWLTERTEDVCGKDATNDWIVGGLHMSETDEGLLPTPYQEFAVNSLVLFCKNNDLWQVEDILEYGG